MQIYFLKHSDCEGGVEPVISSDIFENENWRAIATIRGSVEASQDELSKTMIHIDQSTVPIGISTEPGDFNLNAVFPSFKDDNLAYWYASKSASKVDDGTMEGYGYDPNDNLQPAVVCIITKTGERFIYPNVHGAVTIGKGEAEEHVLNFSGAVLAPTNPANKTIYVLNTKKVQSAGE